MATKKKLLQAAAGVGGAGLDVDEVFSTTLWDGNGFSRNIVNNIDMSGEGGLLWIKNRDGGDPNWISDSERSFSEGLSTNETSIFSGYSNRVVSFRSDGFRIGTTVEVNASNGDSYVSWAWRKAPKFCDIVTYTGNGTAGREIAHGLDAIPGMIIVKCTSLNRHWTVYHRSLGNANNVFLSTTGSSVSSSDWNSTSPTSTHFTVGGANNTNGNGATYVAYIFAHHNGDGEFGPSADQDIIHCGTYTTDPSTGTATVNVGFEPQFIISKRTDATQDWSIFDVARGIYANNDYRLKPNLSVAEASAGNQYNVTGDGFTCQEHNVNATYIFMAIRRGSLFEPENVDDVFSQTTFVGNSTNGRVITSGFMPDIIYHKRRNNAANWLLADRIRGGRDALYVLKTDTNDSQSDPSFRLKNIDIPDGVEIGNDSDVNVSGSSYINYQWKRAPSFCDLTFHKSNGQPTQQIPHNLGVVPEMAWIKSEGDVSNWFVYHKDVTSGKNLLLNSNGAEVTSNTSSAAAFYDTYWTPGNNGILSGGSNNQQYIAYLFASLSGISKVGSYTGTGNTAQTIDCGFSSGAQFVMIKRASLSGDWYLFDTIRGITATVDDSVLKINRNYAEATEEQAFGASIDAIQPDNSGFKVQYSDLNTNGETFIFYAIA